MGPTAREAEQTAAQAHDSTAVRAGARVGLAARGLVWLVIGLLAASVAVGGGGSESTDQAGALRAIADQPLGKVLLWVAAVGFAALAGWLLLSAAVGHRDEDEGKDRWLARGQSLAKALVYAALCAATLRFLLSGQAEDSTSSMTADLMSRTGGRWLVAAVALVVLAIGGYFVHKGVSGDHTECLDTARVPRRLRDPAYYVGLVGYVGRGIVIGLIGLFLVRAAWQFDPQEAKGLDAALQAVVEQPYGRVLMGLAALGLLAFGLWSFIEAAYRKL